MPSRNPITGDLQQTRHSEKVYKKMEEAGELKSLEERRAARGKYKWDPETKKFIPAKEWYEKNPQKPKGRAPMAIINHFEPFQSPIDGTVIENQKQHQYDLEKNDCRVYEGLEQEQKEVDRYLVEQDRELEQTISESVDETAWQIEHNYSRPEAGNKVSWTFGED